MIGNRARFSRLVLIAATLISWSIGAEHITGLLVAVAVLAIAAARIRLAGLDFMELRPAPIPLLATFEVYCVALWAALSGLYLGL